VPRGCGARFVEFIRKFADQCHHGKEEDILFAEMVKSGFSKSSGPLAVMFHEHEQGRAYVRELDRLARQRGPLSGADAKALTKAAFGYTALLRQHIRKEDDILYPMAATRLSAEALESIGRRFDAFESNETGEQEHDRLLQLAGELVAGHAPSSAPGARASAAR
jgi:hemerythrin-like domain-containing protein